MNKFFDVPRGYGCFLEMENLENAAGNHMFAVMDYVAPMPCCAQFVLIPHATSLAALAGYLRYRVVRDMIWFCQDECSFEPQDLDDERIRALTPREAELAEEPIRFWHMLGECFAREDWEETFWRILEEFNNTFPKLDYCTFSFNIFNNADELRKHLIDTYSSCDEDEQNQLRRVCTTESFDPQGFIEYYENMC